MKKFQVLASLMSKGLEKQYEKHMTSGHTNKITQLRLQKEFKANYRKRTANITSSLKPVKYRNTALKMGQLNDSDTEIASK